MKGKVKGNIPTPRKNLAAKDFNNSLNNLKSIDWAFLAGPI